jgi:hypothetical protein
MLHMLPLQSSQIHLCTENVPIFLNARSCSPEKVKRYFRGSGDSLPQRKSGQGLKLTTHLQSVARLIKVASIHSLPHKSLWHSARLVKQGDNFTNFIQFYVSWARSIIVVEALCYKPEGREFKTRWGELIFSIYLILPGPLGLGFTQPLTEMSTRSRKIMFWGVERGRCAGLTTLSSSASLYLYNMGSVRSLNPIGLHGLLRE